MDMDGNWTNTKEAVTRTLALECVGVHSKRHRSVWHLEPGSRSHCETLALLGGEVALVRRAAQPGKDDLWHGVNDLHAFARTYREISHRRSVMSPSGPEQTASMWCRRRDETEGVGHLTLMPSEPAPATVPSDIRERFVIGSAEADVAHFISAKNLHGFLVDLADLVPRHLQPVGKPRIELERDPEMLDHAELAVLIPTDLGVEAAMNRLEALEDEWWPKRSDEEQRSVIVDIRFV